MTMETSKVIKKRGPSPIGSNKCTSSSSSWCARTVADIGDHGLPILCRQFSWWAHCREILSLLRSCSDSLCILCVVFFCFWYHKSFHSIFAEKASLKIIFSSFSWDGLHTYCFCLFVWVVFFFVLWTKIFIHSVYLVTCFWKGSIFILIKMEFFYNCGGFWSKFLCAHDTLNPTRARVRVEGVG